MPGNQSPWWHACGGGMHEAIVAMVGSARHLCRMLSAGSSPRLARWQHQPGRSRGSTLELLPALQASGAGNAACVEQISS
jgi:hypothetical protein